MNREDAKSLLPIITAYAHGEGYVYLWNVIDYLCNENPRKKSR